VSWSGDRTSAITYRALDLLFLRHPMRTSLGVIIGLVIVLFVDVFSPWLATLRYIDVYRANPVLWVAFGVFIMHIPTIIYMFRGARGNEDIEEALKLIREAPFSESERRAKYRALIIAAMQRNLREVRRAEGRGGPGVTPG
jgi:hypothetical protein